MRAAATEVRTGLEISVQAERKPVWAREPMPRPQGTWAKTKLG